MLELRNQEVSFIHVKIEMHVTSRYLPVDVDYLVVHESLEFRGMV